MALPPGRLYQRAGPSGKMAVRTAPRDIHAPSNTGCDRPVDPWHRPSDLAETAGDSLSSLQMQSSSWTAGRGVGYCRGMLASTSPSAALPPFAYALSILCVAVVT